MDLPLLWSGSQLTGQGTLLVLNGVIVMLALLVIKEKIVRHVEKNNANGKDEYRHWNENMNKLTKGLKMDSGKDSTK